MRAPARAGWSSWLLWCLIPSCIAPSEQALDDQDPHQPGEAVGIFTVTGALRDDSCGAESMGAPDHWSFELKLSREGSVLYWLNGREAIVGDVDRRGHFSFESRVEAVITERRGAAKGCTLLRRDVASGELPSPAVSLSGTLSYVYEESLDSECAALPLGADGLPLALPCGLTYSLEGTRKPD